MRRKKPPCPPNPPDHWHASWARSIAGFVVLISGSLGIGMAGYHWTEGHSWLDALLNASMILTGMGPVNPVQTGAGKLFASGYAIFSGVVFLTATAVLLAPGLHRFLRKFHLDMDEEDERRS